MYRIECEWDMGMEWKDTVFKTEELAWQDIHKADWQGLVQMDIEEVVQSGLVNVKPTFFEQNDYNRRNEL